MEYDTLELDPKPVEIPVKIGDLDLLLLEADASCAIAHRNAFQACAMYDANGKFSGLKDSASTEIILLRGNLVYAGTRKPVEEKLIKSWPARIQDTLVAKVREISLVNHTPPERLLLQQAMGRADAPYDWDAFKEWIVTLPEPYRVLRAWVVSSEDKSKNSQPSATVSSASPTS